MKNYRSFVFITITIVFLSSVSALISPVLVQVWSASNDGLTTKRLLCLCGLLLLSGVLEVFCFWVREHFAKKFNINNCQFFLKTFLGMHYDKINELGTIKITTKIRQAVNDFYSYYINGKINIIVSGIILTCILCMMLFYNLLIAGILLLLVVVNVVGYKTLNKELLKRSQKLQEDTAAGWQEINQLVGSTEYIKQLDTTRYLFEQMEPSIDKIYTSMKNINVFAQTVSHSIVVFNNFCQTFIMMFLVFRFFQSNESAYSLIFYTVAMPLFSTNLSEIISGNLDKRNVCVSRDFIKEMNNNQEGNGTYVIQNIQQIAIDFPDWSNGFVQFSPICEIFQKGDIVWIRGKSGCGKSTLMKFLPKLRTTDYIKINDMPLSQIDNQSLRRCVDYVPQASPIFKGTLRENLFFGKKYSAQTEKRMLETPIMRSIFRSKNMDSVITENGSNLSGGELQKIAVTRAIFSEAEVLILDEITSNIDSDTAKEIYQTLLSIHKDKIVFIISHDDVVSDFCNKTVCM